jgi:hypothetical protein
VIKNIIPKVDNRWPCFVSNIDETGNVAEKIGIGMMIERNR